MKKCKTRQGYIAYSCSAGETAPLGGRGLCDECNMFAVRGYLIPVMNHYMCPQCFADWQKWSVFCPKDLPIEKQTAEYYERTIPLTK